MKIVYICSPLRGNLEGNIKKAIDYCSYAESQGVVPLAPHTIFTQFLNDTIPEQREKGLKLGLELLKRCDELWVCGNVISQGMKDEVEEARQQNIPTRYIKESEITQQINQMLFTRAMTMNPDYISMSEIKGSEALKTVEAALTGHPKIGTLHADHDVDIHSLLENQHPPDMKEEIMKIQQQYGPIFLARTESGVVTSVILPEEAHEHMEPDEIQKIEDYIVQASNKVNDPEPVQEESQDFEMSQ